MYPSQYSGPSNMAADLTYQRQSDAFYCSTPQLSASTCVLRTTAHCTIRDTQVQKRQSRRPRMKLPSTIKELLIEAMEEGEGKELPTLVHFIHKKYPKDIMKNGDRPLLELRRTVCKTLSKYPCFVKDKSSDLWYCDVTRVEEGCQTKGSTPKNVPAFAPAPFSHAYGVSNVGPTPFSGHLIGPEPSTSGHISGRYPSPNFSPPTLMTAQHPALFPTPPLQENEVAFGEFTMDQAYAPPPGQFPSMPRDMHAAYTQPRHQAPPPFQANTPIFHQATPNAYGYNANYANAHSQMMIPAHQSFNHNNGYYAPVATPPAPMAPPTYHVHTPNVFFESPSFSPTF